MSQKCVYLWNKKVTVESRILWRAGIWLYPWKQKLWLWKFYSELRNLTKTFEVEPFSSAQLLSHVGLHGLQRARLPCPSPTPRAYSNSCPLSWPCHPTNSSSVVPFSSCPQSFPALGSFPVSQFFTSGGQIIGVSASASVFPMNIQDWFPLR